MVGLEPTKLGDERVEVGVGDLRGVLGVVALVVVRNQGPQRHDAFAEVVGQLIEDHGATTALPRTRSVVDAS